MADQVRRGQIRGGSGDHVAPVAEDRGALAQLEHFFEAMAYEEDGHAAVAGLADDGEEALDRRATLSARRGSEHAHRPRVPWRFR